MTSCQWRSAWRSALSPSSPWCSSSARSAPAPTGLCFLAGWLIGLFGLGVAVVRLIGEAATDSASAPAIWVGSLLLILGLFAIALGIRQWRGRPGPGVEPPTPKWMAAINEFTTVRSLVLGFVFAAVNPKNTTLTLAAGASIAAAGLATGDSIIVLAVFVAIGTLGLVIPLIIYFAMGSPATRVLEDLQQWMAVHNAAIMSVLLSSSAPSSWVAESVW